MLIWWIYQRLFETNFHLILLNKLKYYGIKNVALLLSRSYLLNRFRCVKVNIKIPSLLEVPCGVSHGSFILFLFTLITNEAILLINVFYMLMLQLFK